jgi:solute carrier family 20 (sodium-dependent phosphate transporter)
LTNRARRRLTRVVLSRVAVGAVVFVGAAAFGRKRVAWGLAGRIALTWVLTLPFAGLAAAAVTAALRPAIAT